MDTPQNKFESWAVVEMFGHQKVAGFVTTEFYGQAALFRVDVPELQEREITLTAPEYINGEYAGIGSKVKRQAEPPYSKLIGPSAVYAINPCTEQTVRQYIEADRKLPLIALDIVPRQAQLAASAYAGEDEDVPF
jgi:hypothetical protein